MVYAANESLILENKWVSISVSMSDATVQHVIDKTTGKDICGKAVSFFALVGSDKETEIPTQKLTLEGNVVTIVTSLGIFSVKVESEEDWFTFELMTSLPVGAFKVRFAHAVYDYDLQDAGSCSAIGVAITYWANPCFYPDGKAKETMAEATAHLKDVGARYALIIAPKAQHQQLIKAVSQGIQLGTGIVSPHGGAWSMESELNMGNSFIIEALDEEFILSRIEFFKTLGVDQIDFHKGLKTFCQGDFKYVHYRDDADFKARIADVLEKNGITAGLHTYSSYIDYNCSSILADPKWQKDLSVLETFTLSEDVSEDAAFLPTVESTDGVSNDFGFFSQNTPYLLVGEEIIEFENASGGFRVKQRGAVGSKISFHAKGEKVCHLDGYYHGVSPVMGSELFYQIARNTAKTFCAGGFKTIYLDALDGIIRHCDRKHEAWFYTVAFVAELLANCEYAPMVEYSMMLPCVWAARGRFGAVDTARRGYKCWNIAHAENNKVFLDRYGTATLGWYHFYPLDETDLGNEHTKYHHSDAIHHLGSQAIMHNYNIVLTETPVEDFENCPALRRNIAIYKKYDTLRKQRYFSESLLEKIRNGKYEYHLTEQENGRFAFVEKDYQIKKLYDLKKESGNYSNPFEKQSPFVRIEALLTAGEGNAVTLLEANADQPISQLLGEHPLEKELDLSGLRAKKVSICGNGKPGSAVAIILRCRKGGERARLEYFIDTNYTGWRDFILIESDNGERPDLPFDNFQNKNGTYNNPHTIYRSPFFHDTTFLVEVAATEAAKGVKISSLTAGEHKTAVLEEPAVRIGETEVVFHCKLKSTDYIEFDGKQAKMVDRYGNETNVFFTGELVAPAGDFAASIHTANAESYPLRAQLTLGFTGNIIE